MALSLGVTAFPNGQVMESVAGTPESIFQTLQPAVAAAIGLSALSYFAEMTEGNPTLPFDPIFSQFAPPPVNGAYDYLVGLTIVGYGIPVNTTITSVSGSGGTLAIGISNAPIYSITGISLSILYPANPLIASTVRLAWQPAGAPAWGQNDDTISLEITQQDDEYDKVFNEELLSVPGTGLLFSGVQSTRVWSCRMVCRGPNACNNARLIKRSFSTLDWLQAQLGNSLLYPIPAIAAPIRSKELFEGQWWERWDLVIEMNEQVEEGLYVQSVKSVDITLETVDTVDEFTVTQPD
jgi:hypothetical protein